MSTITTKDGTQILPRNPESDVSGDDPLVTGRIALPHLTEVPDYYTRLAVLEREAADHKSRKK